jgi:hypothetical protein
MVTAFVIDLPCALSVRTPRVLALEYFVVEDAGDVCMLYLVEEEFVLSRSVVFFQDVLLRLINTLDQRICSVASGRKHYL